MTSKNILFVDNDIDYLSILTNYLEELEYSVFPAGNLDSAAEILNSEDIHLAIIDVRMSSENDEDDISGLEFATLPDYQELPKIIVTGFPKYQLARESLKWSTARGRTALNFISKQEGPEALLEAINAAFSQAISINWDLVIRWESPIFGDFTQIAALIKWSQPNPNLTRLADELEIVTRKAFFNSDAVAIDQVFWSCPEEVGIQISSTTAGETRNYFSILGQLPQIEEVYNNFMLMSSYSSAGWRVQGPQKCTSTNVGLVSWGVEKEEIKSIFHTSNMGLLADADREKLFSAVFPSNKYEKITIASPDHLLELVRDSEKPIIKLAKLLEQAEDGVQIVTSAMSSLGAKIKKTKDNTNIRVRGEKVSIPNPLALQEIFKSFVGIDIPIAEIPAQREAKTFLLLDKVLIPTYLRNSAPKISWINFLILELYFRHYRLNFDGPSQIAEFEALLHENQPSPREMSTTLGENWRDAIIFISSLRSYITNVVDISNINYFVFLLLLQLDHFATIGIRPGRVELDLIREYHFLVAFSSTVDYLNSMRDARNDNKNAIYVDVDNKEIFVAGKKRDVTPSEYDLLLYLYKHKNQLCGRGDILNDVFGYSQIDKKSGDNLLNTTIARLRAQIENDPSNPTYIKTVRGRGYKLQI